ncbi:hypothetical protein GOV07_04260 [Candidatus Woesearchaeota archaeon]|nr:hypothetical protein [Candidatus Woesearchaeota archaeon]
MQRLATTYQGTSCVDMTSSQEALPSLYHIATTFLSACSRVLNIKSPEHAFHRTRVRDFAYAVSRDPRIAFVAFHHDDGKIGIPVKLLHAKRPLTEDERKVMKKHNEYTRNILRMVEPHGYSGLSTLAASAHDYRRKEQVVIPFPDRRQNNPYLLYVKEVLQACDAFDVLVHGRVYQPPVSIEEAIATLLESEVNFDEGLVRELGDIKRVQRRKVA